MLRHILALTGLLASALAAGPAAAECQLLEIGRLPVTMTPGYGPVVPGKVRGQPIKVLVNTSSTHTVFNESSTKRLGIPTEEAENLRGADTRGEIRVLLGRFVDLEIGGLKIPDRNLPVRGEAGGSAVDGAMGFDIFQLVDLDLDLKNSMIRLFEPRGACSDSLAHWNPAAEALPMLGNREEIVVKVLVNGEGVNAKVSTTASRSYISWAAAKRLGVTPETQGVQLQGKNPRANPNGLYRFATFQIGEETIKNPTLGISDTFVVGTVDTGSHVARRRSEVEMILGTDFLRAHHVYVSNKQRQLYFTYEGGEVFAKQQQLGSQDHMDAR